MGGMRQVQPEEGRHDRGAGGPQARPPGLPPHRTRASERRPQVPAELSARELDGLSLLGCGAGGLGTSGFQDSKLNHSSRPGEVFASTLEAST